MMPGDTQGAGGIARRNPTLAAIGRYLAEMYDGYLRAALPQRFVLLLSQIDAREQEKKWTALSQQEGAAKEKGN